MPSAALPACRLSVALSLCLSVLTATAQEDTEQDEFPYRPGLVASYTAGGASATRIDETIAFDWQDAPPDPRMGAGPFQAKWTGRLWTQVAGQHRLAIYAAGGKATLKLAGRELISAAAAEPAWLVSDPLELEFDRHPLEVTFEKTGPRARLGLYWLGPGFGLEPVPERFLMHDRQGSPAAHFERGRRLAAALRCGACHGDAPHGVELPAPALDKLAGNIEA
ncbi:MAG: PA14 domain-containing protein, partial [Planctomycetaceae bacterium]|nr:PA14 domain-containing protein [Planctomycetaceae bacterium]